MSSPSNNKGMTLLEIVVVMTLLAGFFVVGLPLIKKRENAVKKMLRSFMALNRKLDSQARLNGVTYRLVFSIDPNDSSWWVEKQTPPDEQKLVVDKSLDDSLNDELSDDSLNDTKQSDTIIDKARQKLLEQNLSHNEFKKDISVLKKVQTLPSGLVFESVSVNNNKNIVSQGLSYVYYTPRGQFNKVLLKIKGRSRYWSLLFNRLNGELDIFPENKQW